MHWEKALCDAHEVADDTEAYYLTEQRERLPSACAYSVSSYDSEKCLQRISRERDCVLYDRERNEAREWLLKLRVTLRVCLEKYMLEGCSETLTTIWLVEICSI